MNHKEVVEKVLSIFTGTKKILNYKNINIEKKSGIGNLVTNVDKMLEQYLKDELLKIFPDSQFIGEESAENNIEKNNNGLKFIVDPLDGTTNFTNGWPHTISIGIADNNKLICGIIYEVLQDAIYCGINGNGVYRASIDNISGLKRVISPEHKTETLKKAVISYDTPYSAEAFKITKEMMSNLYYNGASLKTVGPISLDVLKTALGKENRPNDYNDAVWHTEVRAWDLAAATVILRELGGEIIGKDGKPLSTEILTSPTEKICFIASGNFKLLDKLYELYKKSEKFVKNNIINKYD